jgi:REP element-mobilizing transposase RayT
MSHQHVTSGTARIRQPSILSNHARKFFFDPHSRRVLNQRSTPLAYFRDPRTIVAIPIKTGEALEFRVLAVGGEVDHVHLLIVVPSKIAVSVAIQKLKANSSRWIRDTFRLKLFSWQDGYGAFSVSVSNTQAVVAYIDGQAEHHRKRDSRAEFEQMLRMHGVTIESPPSCGL